MRLRPKKKTEKEVEKPKYDVFITSDGSYKTKLSKKFLDRKPYSPPDTKKVFSEIPGTIIDIFVNVGDEIEQGDILLVLEAMKMQNKIISPISGKIKSIETSVGNRIPKGFLMLEFE